MTNPTKATSLQTTRRSVLIGSSAAMASIALPFPVFAHTSRRLTGDMDMATFTTTDGTNIFYKDWGPKDAQPIVFHHGWAAQLR